MGHTVNNRAASYRVTLRYSGYGNNLRDRTNFFSFHNFDLLILYPDRPVWSLLSITSDSELENCRRGLEISVWFWFVRRVSVELDTMIDKPLNSEERG